MTVVNRFDLHSSHSKFMRLTIFSRKTTIEFQNFDEDGEVEKSRQALEIDLKNAIFNQIYKKVRKNVFVACSFNVLFFETHSLLPPLLTPSCIF